MVLEYKIGWQRLPYPPIWINSFPNNVTLGQGGQQCSPDGNFLYIWQTGAKTGGLGIFALYDVVANAWSQTTFSATAVPTMFSPVTLKSALSGSYVCSFDLNTQEMIVINLGGPALPTPKFGTIFDMVHQSSPFGLGIAGAVSIMHLEDDFNVLWIPYGNVNFQNSSAAVRANIDRTTVIHLCDPGIFAADGFAYGYRVSISGQPNDGNGAQSAIPMRWYDNNGGGVSSRYFTGSSCVDDTPLFNPPDQAIWGAPISAPFVSANFGSSPRVNAFQKTNTSFEQQLMDLAFNDVTICLDRQSFVKPFHTGGLLIGVEHCPFNLDTQDIGIPIAVDAPAGFGTDGSWSIYEMAGTTYILDGIGNFYRLAVGSTFLNIQNVVNWRRNLRSH